jgi:orotate phosphoribosyltransferase
VRSTIGALRALDAEIVAIAVLVDRSGGAAAFGCPLLSLVTLAIDTWDAGDLPAWLGAIPITKPGTTRGDAG